MKNMEAHRSRIESVFNSKDVKDINMLLEKQSTEYMVALSHICPKKLIGKYLDSIYNILRSKLTVNELEAIVKDMILDRPIDSYTRSTKHIPTLLVLSLIGIFVKDYMLLKNVFLVYTMYRYYVSFVTRVKYCDISTMDTSIDHMEQRSLIKKFGGDHVKLALYIANRYEREYLQPVYKHGKDIDTIAQVLKMFDYIRTQCKSLQKPLIAKYYELKNNPEVLERLKTNEVDLSISVYINQILLHLRRIIESERMHPTINTTSLPNDVAKCLCSNINAESEQFITHVSRTLHLIDKAIVDSGKKGENIHPCSEKFFPKIMKMYRNKKVQPFFIALDKYLIDTIGRCPDHMSIKWLGLTKKFVVYRLEIRTYFFKLIYRAITNTLCAHK